MYNIKEYLGEKWINNEKEVSEIIDFFDEAEIKNTLYEVEKNRKKRQTVIIIFIVIIWILFYFSLFFWKYWTVTTNWLSREMTLLEAFLTRSIYFIPLVFIIISFVTQIFRNKIERNIKTKILTWLAKILHPLLIYNPEKIFLYKNSNLGGSISNVFTLAKNITTSWINLVKQEIDNLNSIYKSEYALELKNLEKEWFLNSFSFIEKIEDSIALKFEQDSKIAYIEWYEFITARKWRKNNSVVTNHCYMMKVNFPESRINVNKNILIKKDLSDSLTKQIFRSIFFTLFTIAPIIFIIKWFNLLYIYSFPLLFIIFLLIYFLQKKLINRNRIKLENLEFEKIFDVKCDDQITSRMIITPAFMDRLIKLTNRTGKSYSLFFTWNTFYVKWDVYDNYLEINTWKNILRNIGVFIDWYTEMKWILSFIEDMKIMYLSKSVIDNNNINSNIDSNFLNDTNYTNKTYINWFLKIKYWIIFFLPIIIYFGVIFLIPIISRENIKEDIWNVQTMDVNSIKSNLDWKIIYATWYISGSSWILLKEYLSNISVTWVILENKIEIYTNNNLDKSKNANISWLDKNKINLPEWIYPKFVKSAWTSLANKIKLWEYDLDYKYLLEIKNKDIILLTNKDLTVFKIRNLIKNAKLDSGYIYVWNWNIKKPEIWDIRISYYYLPNNTEISLIWKLVGNKIIYSINSTIKRWIIPKENIIK